MESSDSASNILRTIFIAIPQPVDGAIIAACQAGKALLEPYDCHCQLSSSGGAVGVVSIKLPRGFRIFRIQRFS